MSDVSDAPVIRPAVLVRLDKVVARELRELLTDAWRCQAPRTMVKEFDASR